MKIKIDVFKNVLSRCLNPSNEHILLIGDNGVGSNKASVFLTEAYSLACEEMGLKYEAVYQNTKTRGESADPVVVKKIKNLPKGSIAMINVSNRIGSMEALGHSLRGYMKQKGHRFTSASTVGTITPKTLPVLVNALDVDYNAIHKRTMKIKQMLDNGREAHISSKAGTDLVMGIEGMQGRCADGIYLEPGTGGNLPGSEAYIAPFKKEVDGVAVIDGSARVRNGTRLITTNGIKMTINNGSITSFNKNRDARELEDTILWAHKKSAHPWGVRRIGELGIGTNPNAKIIGSTIVDEKVKGSAHIAIGSNQWFGGSIYSIIHLDQVMRDARVKIDGRLVKP